MPNHVTTILVADPEVISSLVRTLTPEEQLAAHKKELEDFPRMKAKSLEDFEERKIVDFELLIPSPPNKETGGCGGSHEAGVVCWYEWNVANWGTKWGAYDAVIDDRADRLEFDTAWSHPLPVVQALARKFPDKAIEVKYADEDLGSNLGHYAIWHEAAVSLEDDEQFVVKELTKFGHYDDEVNKEFAAQVKHGMSYAELKASWDEDEIDMARRAKFAKQLEKERGIDSPAAYALIRSNEVDIPQEIVDAIQTVEDANAYWEED